MKGFEHGTTEFPSEEVLGNNIESERDIIKENVHFFRFALIKLALRQMAGGREVETGTEDGKEFNLIPTTALANLQTGEVFDETRLRYLTNEAREEIETLTFKVKVGTQIKGSVIEILWGEGFSENAKSVIENAVEEYNQLNK